MPKKTRGNPGRRAGATPAAKAGADRSRKQASSAAARAMAGPRFSTNFKVTAGLLAVVLIGLATMLFYVQRGTAADTERVLRADSHRLSTAADGRVTLVEFLDYECPACAQAFPGVEQLRAEYDGQLTYVVRNFPLPMHRNAENAARAAEAAARQGQFEQMYVALFENQTAWAGQQQDQSALFESYAQQIGLDLDRYRADLADPALTDRINRDKSDGEAAGVRGTPTFFLNGEPFDGEPTYAGLKAAVDAALAG